MIHLISQVFKFRNEKFLNVKINFFYFHYLKIGWLSKKKRCRLYLIIVHELQHFIPGLFRRVILMSGSMFSSWARVRDPLNYALQLAKHFNCSIPNDLTNDHDQVPLIISSFEFSYYEPLHRQIVNCLRTISAERLLGAKLNVPSFHLEFGPSFDGITIKDNFSDMKWKRSFGAR